MGRTARASPQGRNGRRRPSQLECWTASLFREEEGNELREGGKGHTMLCLVSCDTEIGLHGCNGNLLKVLNRAVELAQSNLYFFLKLNVCLFIYGCSGSSLLCLGFL